MSDNNNQPTNPVTLLERVRAIVPTEMTCEKYTFGIIGVTPLECVQITQKVEHPGYKSIEYGYIFSHRDTKHSWSDKIKYGWSVRYSPESRDFKYTNMTFLEKAVESLVVKLKECVEYRENEYVQRLNQLEAEKKMREKLDEVIKTLTAKGYVFKHDDRQHHLIRLVLVHDDRRYIAIQGNVYNRDTLEMRYWVDNGGRVDMEMTESQMEEFVALVKKWGYKEVA